MRVACALTFDVAQSLRANLQSSFYSKGELGKVRCVHLPSGFLLTWAALFRDELLRDPQRTLQALVLGIAQIIGCSPDDKGPPAKLG